MLCALVVLLLVAIFALCLPGCAENDLKWYIVQSTRCCEGDEAACQELTDAGYELPDCK